MDILITIDTEISSVRVANWRETGLAAEIERDIFGHTAEGDFGIAYQMDVMNAHGLRATFFLEVLFACAVGLKPLRRMVNAIRTRGHDVQLHMHPDWLRFMASPPVAAEAASTMCAYTREQQMAIMERGLENLWACEIDRICAFRAGDFDANRDTLLALRASGIPFDSSVNGTYGRACQSVVGVPLLSPKNIGGVIEFPVTLFRTFNGVLRPLQVCACSSGEMESALTEGWKRNWRAMVLLLHSFELIKRPSVPGEFGRPAPIRRRRFERLCEFLGANRDKFRTRVFAELTAEESLGMATEDSADRLCVPFHHTVRRYVEQAADHLF